MIRFCSLLLLLATPVAADFRGTIDVVDGDTLHVGEVTVRLHGIDAPEVDQSCDDADGQPWMCGAFVQSLVRETYQGQTANCEEVDRDRYGRSVAKCHVNGRDIGEDIVSSGWAAAYRRYSMDYDQAEKTAQGRGIGLWAGSMQSPAAYRADQRTTSAPDVAPGGCAIKGNISSSGQIYHMPHNRDYGKTRISTANGERWFCTEAEAQAAGWRAARN